MALTFGSSDGVLNGVTPVTLVGAPGSGVQRVVRSMVVYNADTASVTLTVRYVSGANTRVLFKETLTAGSSFKFGDSGGALVLNSTGKSVTAVLAGAPATTQPDFVVAYVDQ